MDSVFWVGKQFEGGKTFDFRRTTVFCLGCRLSKHKMTRYSKNVEGMAPASLTAPMGGLFV